MFGWHRKTSIILMRPLILSAHSISASTTRPMFATSDNKYVSGFDAGDKIGVGLLVVQQSATAKAANCSRCRQPNLWLFYTKNGEIWGNFKINL